MDNDNDTATNSTHPALTEPNAPVDTIKPDVPGATLIVQDGVDLGTGKSAVTDTYLPPKAVDDGTGVPVKLPRGDAFVGATSPGAKAQKCQKAARRGSRPKKKISHAKKMTLNAKPKHSVEWRKAHRAKVRARNAEARIARMAEEKNRKDAEEQDKRIQAIDEHVKKLQTQGVEAQLANLPEGRKARILRRMATRALDGVAAAAGASAAL